MVRKHVDSELGRRVRCTRRRKATLRKALRGKWRKPARYTRCVRCVGSQCSLGIQGYCDVTLGKDVMLRALSPWSQGPLDACSNGATSP